MRGMILAAGRGMRMGALSEQCPKPLLQVGGMSLIEWQLRRLRAGGVREVVINLAYRGDMIHAALGDGQRLGMRLHYSREAQGLETGGGIVRALPLLREAGQEAFVLVNADVFCTLDYGAWLARARARTQVRHSAGYVVCVPTPDWKRCGDFSIDADGNLRTGATWTFAGISVLNYELFCDKSDDFQRLAPWLNEWAAEGRLGAEVFTGFFCDAGTPQRLAALEEHLRRDPALARIP